jgi:cephalosporin hydroxylase
MRTQRFNPPEDWLATEHWNYNQYFMDFVAMLRFISLHFKVTKKSRPVRMIEIGSYMGESTMLFAASGIFDSIWAIDPFKGDDPAMGLGKQGLSWKDIKNEYDNNTRYFSNITLYEDYSYNVVEKFPNEYADFIYIDGAHDYESVVQDLECYLPKVKKGGLIGGHDYNKWYEPYEDVMRAVDHVVGKPNKVYPDTSWLKIIR